MLHSTGPFERKGVGFSGGKKAAPPTSPQTYGQERAWEDLDREGGQFRLLASRFLQGKDGEEVGRLIDQVIRRLKVAVLAGGE